MNRMQGRRESFAPWPGMWFAIPLLASLAAHAAAHDGDAEDRAVRLLAGLQSADRAWVRVANGQDAAGRRAALAEHARALAFVQETLRDAADRSPCVLLEAGDAGRQLACLVDTEARLRATERLTGHLLNRIAIDEATPARGAAQSSP